jgi:hypothetical protein
MAPCLRRRRIRDARALAVSSRGSEESGHETGIVCERLQQQEARSALHDRGLTVANVDFQSKEERDRCMGGHLYEGRCQPTSRRDGYTCRNNPPRSGGM